MSDKAVLLISYISRGGKLIPYFHICTDGSAYYYYDTLANHYTDRGDKLRNSVLDHANFNKGSWYNLEFKGDNFYFIEVSNPPEGDKIRFYECVFDMGIKDDLNTCKVCQYLKKTSLKDVQCPSCGK